MGPRKHYDELMPCLNFYDFKYTKIYANAFSESLSYSSIVMTISC